MHKIAKLFLKDLQSYSDDDIMVMGKYFKFDVDGNVNQLRKKIAELQAVNLRKATMGRGRRAIEESDSDDDTSDIEFEPRRPIMEDSDDSFVVPDDVIEYESDYSGESDDDTNDIKFERRRPIIKDSDSESENDDDEEIYTVERIIDDKIKNGKHLFKVRWQGYGPNDDTWEPEESFVDPIPLIKYKKQKAYNSGKDEISDDDSLESFGYDFRNTHSQLGQRDYSGMEPTYTHNVNPKMPRNLMRKELSIYEGHYGTIGRETGKLKQPYKNPLTAPIDDIIYHAAKVYKKGTCDICNTSAGAGVRNTWIYINGEKYLVHPCCAEKLSYLPKMAKILQYMDKNINNTTQFEKAKEDFEEIETKSHKAIAACQSKYA